MEQEYETGADDNVIKIMPDETKKQLEEDAIFRLEYDNEAKAVAQEAKRRLDSLLELSESVNKQDYDINCQLRHKNRSARNRGECSVVLCRVYGAIHKKREPACSPDRSPRHSLFSLLQRKF